MTTIRALLSNDDRTSFRCGDIELDRFFQQFAGQNQFRHYIGTTYVAVQDDGRIAGYATVAPGSLELDAVPEKIRKGLPAYPLPILRFARLAVHSELQQQGLGPELVRYVLRLAMKMGEDLGCFGVVVDAYASAVTFYERFGFFPVDVIEGESPTRPETSSMFLALKTIKAAAKPKKR